jgi:hypothetical protein
MPSTPFTPVPVTLTRRRGQTADNLHAVTLTLMEGCLPLTCISKRRHEKKLFDTVWSEVTYRQEIHHQRKITTVNACLSFWRNFCEESQ